MLYHRLTESPRDAQESSHGLVIAGYLSDDEQIVEDDHSAAQGLQTAGVNVGVLPQLCGVDRSPHNIQD